MSEKASIAVIGSGAMGSGIAQIAAEAGHPVLLYDNNPAALDRAKSALQDLMQKLVTRGKRSQEEADHILGRIRFVNELLTLDEASLVIEAIIEDLQIKSRLFEDLSTVVSDRAILASNTSSLSLSAIARHAQHPERVLGLHFFNPAPLMPLVEVIPAAQSDEEHVGAMMRLMKEWGKSPIRTVDTPGFIVNRVARPYYSEALRIYDEGLASAAQIDAAMEAMGFRMGPFVLMDFIGHDVNFRVTESMFHAFWGEPRYKPSFAQKRLLDAGYLGRKSGRGFYRYEERQQAIREDVSDWLGEASNPSAEAREIQHRIVDLLINEAADAWHYGVASAEDIDSAMRLGVNYPIDLLAFAKTQGVDAIIQRLDLRFAHYHEERFRVSPGLRKWEAQEGVLRRW